jgi:hypothetical protein
MEQMNITMARYQADPDTNETACICIELDGNGVMLSVPLDPANRHYAEISKQVAAGTLTIADAD